MNSSSTEFEKMLREAITQAKAAAPRAAEDLVQCASTAAEAISRVTEGMAALELALLNQTGDSLPTYQLQLRRIRSEAPPSDLGIYQLSAAGYPVQRWYSRRKWEDQPDQPDQLFPNVEEVGDHFKWMISNPKSRLVALVAFFQQQAPASGGGRTSPI